MDVAKKVSKSQPRIVSILNIFELGLNILHKNAIWTNTKFNDKIRELCKIKADMGMLELLPSQRKALGDNLLDVAANVTVLQMPTSAGKTLLAEFNIIITKALRADAKIVYIVPSRALVNQVYFDLKSDLGELGFAIEKTSSAIEIDPTENSFLTGDEKIDVLVSTPEKLDLLIRRRHPSVEDVSMFIVDEAHTIQNGERGAKLELLLAILRREKPNAKYMLLSPFIKNANETITEWLGGGNSIFVDWKPSEKLIIGLNTKINKTKNEIHLEVLNSPYDSIKPIEKTVFNNPYQIESSGEKDKIFEFSIKHFSESDKTMLILCYGKGTANSRADFIYNRIEKNSLSDDVKLVKKFIEDEVGSGTTLSKVISKGIVTHHSGMSDETKLLVEHLIRQKQIQYVCATTTIAEGVNFPVSSVFFDDFRRGQHSRLDSNDFWNIAGRAGRTLVDNYGKIIMPFNSAANINNAKELIKDSANVLTSVLAQLFDNADSIERSLTTPNGFTHLFSNYSDSLVPLFQYFVHLLNVSEHEYYITEIEDLFKDSLQYHLLDDNDKREKFISICKSIYLHLQNNYKDRGVIAFADKTGFSVPSVLNVMREARSNIEIRDLSTWSKEQLFDSSNQQNLTEKIKVIAALRETRLGVQANTPFNAELYAKIIIDWVKGDNLVSIANLHPTFNIQDANAHDTENRITNFVKKMNDIRFKASWGLSVLEGIVKGDTDIKDSHIPSLVYFGVDNEKSLAFRMIGVPRSLAFSFQNLIEGNLNEYSYRSLRNTVSSLTNNDWDDFRPRNSSLTGMEWKRISEILVK
ncbi:DEAD/DEAH box helicase [Chryseobacterium sp. ISL-6]|nr:DEAD/DEAH box helicase [Chryseobacterium sp. ISL-6]MBT2620354.1 DEAD/DEAH box helicase [Chryseobacterium sp. ISL-6]